MTQKRKRKRSAARPSSRGSADTQPATEATERHWTQSRSGGRAGRGFHFQDAVGAWLTALVADGSTISGELVPEGLEDISLEGDAPLDMQIKSRSEHLGLFSATKAADHVLDTFEKSENSRTATHRVAVFFENGIEGTRPLGLSFEALSATLSADDSLLRALNERAEKRGYAPGRTEQLMLRTSVLDSSWSAILDSTVARIASISPAPPTACRYIAGELRLTVADAADKNASATFADRTRLTRSVLLRLIADFTEHLDIDALEGAIRSGACEFLDYGPAESIDDRFYEGVAAQPHHVRQGLVVPRPDITHEVTRALDSGRAVVLTGPSGVGKSAVLWTVPLSHEPCTWFRVRRLTNSDIPELVRLAKTYGANPARPVGFLVDAAGAGDFSGWSRLREAASSMPGVLLVGTARNEDIAVLGDLAESSVISVSLDERGAEAIYEGLKARNVCHLDHWREAYLNARGLTMEYTHLLTSGRRLAEVIADQVSVRVEEDRLDEVRILAVVSTADRWSAVASTDSLAMECGLDPIAMRAPLRRLMDEHLLIEREGAVAGLHQLRSAAISEAIHATPPPRLEQSVSSILRCADPSTIVRFTANVLRDEPGQLAAIRSALPNDSSAERVAALLRGVQLFDFSCLAQEWVGIAERHNVHVSSRPILMQFAAAQLTFPDFFPEPIRAAHAEMVTHPVPNQSGEIASAIGADRLLSLVLESDRPTDAARLLAAIEASDLDLRSELGEAKLASSLLVTSLRTTDLYEFGELMTAANFVSTQFARRLLDEVGGPSFVFDALRRLHPWIVEAETRQVDGRAVGWSRFIHHSDEKQDDARSTVLSIARLLLRCLPEIETVDVQAVFPGGQLYKVGDYSPGVSGMVRSADHTEIAVSWNRERLHAAMSLLGSADTDRLTEAFPLLEETASTVRSVATAYVTGATSTSDADVGPRLTALHKAAIELRPPPTGPRVAAGDLEGDDKTGHSDPLSGLITDFTGNAIARLADRSTHAALNAYLHDQVLGKSIPACRSEPWQLIGLDDPPTSLEQLRATVTDLGAVVSESARVDADLAAIGRAARAGTRERALNRAAAAARKAARRRHRAHLDSLTASLGSLSVDALVVPTGDPSPSGTQDILIRLTLDSLLDWFDAIAVTAEALAEHRETLDRFVIVPYRNGQAVHGLAISMVNTPFPATNLEPFDEYLGERRPTILADTIQAAVGAMTMMSTLNLLPKEQQEHETIRRLLTEAQVELNQSIKDLGKFEPDDFIEEVAGMLADFARQLDEECEEDYVASPLAEQITLGALNGLDTQASQQLAFANVAAIEWEIDQARLLERLYS